MADHRTPNCQHDQFPPPPPAGYPRGVIICGRCWPPRPGNASTVTDLDGDGIVVAPVEGLPYVAVQIISRSAEVHLTPGQARTIAAALNDYAVESNSTLHVGKG